MVQLTFKGIVEQTLYPLLGKAYRISKRETIVSFGYLIRVPVHHSTQLPDGPSLEGTHQSDNGTFSGQLSSTEQCPNKPVNLLLFWVVFVIIWWHFGFLGGKIFSDGRPPIKSKREIVKQYNETQEGDYRKRVKVFIKNI